jgi:hypothetical protein
MASPFVHNATLGERFPTHDSRPPNAARSTAASAGAGTHGRSRRRLGSNFRCVQEGEIFLQNLCEYTCKR